MIDDDHASEIPIGLDGAPGVPLRQDWPSTPSDQRVASTSVSFSGPGDVHGFSTRCVDDACTLSWHAISATAPLGTDVREIDYASVTQLVISEFGTTDSTTDLGIFGRQTDGDEVATLLIDNSYDRTSFRTSKNQKVFPRTMCAELGEVVAMGTARITLPGVARSLILLDRTGRGHAVHPSGPCTVLALQLP